ncbi:MAG TPA: maleylpyruvate isomerase N-terminal domain-containing protein [Micromonosporaceae bacterium]
MDQGDLSAVVGADPFDLIDRECDRVDEFYTYLSESEWSAPTRCAGWSRRDLLAHLAAGEDYTRAGLDGRVAEFLESSGAASMDEFNEWGIRKRAALPPAELLAEWRELCRDNRARLRERGVDGTIDTSVGDYPVGKQTYYLAAEVATHADDAGVPIRDTEREQRLDWRTRFARVAVDDSGRGVSVSPQGGAEVVQLGDDQVRLTDEEFVEAVARRLPGPFPIPDTLREALVVLA